MKQDVILTFTTRIDHQDQDELETIELVSRGVLMEESPNHYRINYEESQMSGTNATDSTLFIEPDCIYLQRTGDVNSATTFQQGVRHQSAYNTPYGAVCLEVHTRVLRQNITMTGGEIYLEYDMEMSKNLVSKLFFQVKVDLPKVRAL